MVKVTDDDLAINFSRPDKREVLPLRPRYAVRPWVIGTVPEPLRVV
jgi:hypothetical protein